MVFNLEINEKIDLIRQKKADIFRHEINTYIPLLDLVWDYFFDIIQNNGGKISFTQLGEGNQFRGLVLRFETCTCYLNNFNESECIHHKTLDQIFSKLSPYKKDQLHCSDIYYPKKEHLDILSKYIYIKTYLLSTISFNCSTLIFTIDIII